MSIMQATAPDAPEQADAPGGQYKAPDIAQFTPPEVKDAVDRIVAAGMRVMYSPAAEQHVQEAVQSQEPLPKVLAENVTGLLLTLDQQAKGGMPAAALFPAAMGLLGEACKMMESAGKTCTQDDYNNAAITMYAMIGQKLGGKPEDLMGAAAQSLQGQNPDPGAPQAPPQQAAPGAAPAA